MVYYCAAPSDRLNDQVLQVTVYGAKVARGTQDSMIVAGAANIMKQLLEGSGVRLAEPIMRLEVITDQELVGAVVQDMVQRRGNVLSTAGMSENCVVTGDVPLAELAGYSKDLRTITSGRADINMQLSHYQVMTPHHQDEAIREVTGFS